MTLLPETDLAAIAKMRTIFVWRGHTPVPLQDAEIAAGMTQADVDEQIELAATATDQTLVRWHMSNGHGQRDAEANTARRTHTCRIQPDQIVVIQRSWGVPLPPVETWSTGD